MKALLVGIDGGAWNLIEEFKGDMNFVSEIVEEGTHGTLRSTIPPVTLPAWPSMFTGYNPAQHGIPSFLDKEMRPVSAKDLKKPPFWEVLSTRGLRSIIFNVPATYPPRPLLGILVSGMGAEKGSRFAYPEEIFSELKEKGYKVEPDIEIVHTLPSSRNSRETLLKFEEDHLNCFLKYASSQDFDFGFYVIRITDISQHFCWTKREYLRKVYSKVNEIVKKLYEKLSPELLMISSDHGFSEYWEAFSIKAFLSSLGMLKVKESEGKRDSLLGKAVKSLGISPERIPKPLLSLLRKITPAKIREEVSPATEVDYENSLAYGEWFQYGVCINERKAKDYEGLRKELLERLRALRDRKGRRIFKWVKRKEEVYQGPYLDRLPDVLFEPEDWIFPAGSKWAKDPIEEYFSWQHHVNGIFLAYGEKVRNARINAEIWDIAPTILHYFSLPLPEDMEGKPRTEIFKEGSGLEKGVRVTSSKEYLKEKRAISKAIEKLKGRSV